jgi:glycyl-tRNA synthetase
MWCVVAWHHGLWLEQAAGHVTAESGGASRQRPGALSPQSTPAPPPFPPAAAVATAIFESVLPRHAGDDLPASPAGVLVSVADK